MSGEQAGTNITFWSTVKSIVWKDLVIERNTRQTIAVMFVFAVAAVVVFSLALEGNLSAASDVATGYLWVVIVLAGTLGLNRILLLEEENRTIDAILLAPVDRSAVYLGKVLSMTVLLFTLELALVPMFILMFNKPLYRPVPLLLVILGTIGYAAAGVLIAAMSVQTRARAILLPIILLPLTLPLILAAASATGQYMLDQLPQWSDVQFSVSLVIAYDALMLTVGVLTYHYVLES